MAEVVLLLSNPFSQNKGQTKDEISLRFKIFEHSTAKKWLYELKRILQVGKSTENKLNHLEKNFCFMGFLDPQRDLAYLTKRINYFICRINESSKRLGFTDRYYINLQFDEGDLTFSGVQNRQLLNDIHHFFEIFSGPVWDRSDFFKALNTSDHFYLRQLNNLCHEIEHCTRNQSVWFEKPEFRFPYLQISFLLAPRIELEPADYENFSLDRQFGTINMHYCQTGKTHWEAFNDNDEVILEKGISQLRYMSAEFDIDLAANWQQTPDGIKHWAEKKEQFYTWLKNRGYDPNSKMLGLGTLQLGRIIMDDFGTMRIPEIQDMMRRYLNIQKISIYDGSSKVEQDYPYFWFDPDYDKLQLKLLWNNNPPPETPHLTDSNCARSGITLAKS